MDHQALSPKTDRKKVRYDLSKHNWPEYWLKIAQEKYPQIESLETVHKTLSASEISILGRHCQSFCGSDELNVPYPLKNQIGISQLHFNLFYFFIRAV